MPRQVDHVARRRHVAATAAEIIGDQGLDGLTFRKVAEASGCSTTIVTHYFVDKRDLLLATFREVAERAGQRFDEAHRRSSGLRGCLEALLPLDPVRRTEWRLLTCFWGMAIGDPLLAGEEASHVRSAVQRVVRLLGDQFPEWTEADREVLARRLITVVHGLGAHSALDPQHWSAVQQRRVLASELASILPPGI